MRRIWIIAISLGLAGCGGDAPLIGLDAVSDLGQQILGPKRDDLRERLTPDVVRRIDGPVMLFELSESGAQSAGVVIGQRGGTMVWSTPDSIHIMLRDGVLFGTRGLPNDLLSAEIDQVVRALHSKHAEAVRFHQYLTGEEQVETRVFICDYSFSRVPQFQTLFHAYSGTRITERCTTSDQEIENHYLYDSAGVLRKSRQWVGPFNGFLTTELLKQGEVIE